MKARLPWFKCYPEKLLGAMSMMKPDEQLLYVIVLLRIYETDGSCIDGFDDLAMRARLPSSRVELALESLIAKGKLVVKGKFFTNPMADAELEARNGRAEAAKNNADARWKKGKENQPPKDAPALRLESEGNAIKIQNKKKKDSRPADESYVQEFEDLWKAYPRTRGTSKKKAYDIWRMLNDQNRERVRKAIPLYADQMRREARPEEKIKHMQFWLSERYYETLGGPPTQTNIVEMPWWKTASRENWQSILLIWSGTNDWKASWGPEPGKPGCSVPDDMVEEHNRKYRGHLLAKA